MTKILPILLLLTTLTACYKMPGPDDYSLVPTTNNPAFTKESHGASPGVGY